MNDNVLSPNTSKVFAVIILRNDGSRIYSKYYNKVFPTLLLKVYFIEKYIFLSLFEYKMGIKNYKRFKF